MMRKPFQLVTVLLILLLCSWMMDATLLDVGADISSRDLRNGAGPQDAHAYSVSGYILNRSTAWNHSFTKRDTSVSLESIENTDPSDIDETSTSHQPDITTLLLLGYGIIGVVGFWRRVTR